MYIQDMWYAAVGLVYSWHDGVLCAMVTYSLVQFEEYMWFDGVQFSQLLMIYSVIITDYSLIYSGA